MISANVSRIRFSGDSDSMSSPCVLLKDCSDVPSILVQIVVQDTSSVSHATNTPLLNTIREAVMPSILAQSNDGLRGRWRRLRYDDAVNNNDAPMTRAAATHAIPQW